MIEKKMSLAVLLALMVQTGGVFVWAGAATERIADLERRAEQGRPVIERLARVEAQLELVLLQLDRIEHKVDEG